MSVIKILPEILSNKIAAGEVVERPASVVKELLENSLDARATRIIVELNNGGRSLIRVSDNGIGMSHDDALLAIERYATSKIYDDNDLFAIKTLGFRGEALPSIASVSRFTLETRDEASDSGVRVEIEGGKIRNVTEVGVPVGTLITVRNLFFNTPARRKFLKTVNTEMGHIADIVSGIALSRPDLQISLGHNGKLVKRWTAVSDPATRAADVLGRDTVRELLPAVCQNGHVRVSGWIASPRVWRSTTRGIFVFVNGRSVRDRIIRNALLSGYSQRIVRGRFPVAVLFVDVPPDDVDVNVHPTKSEVRFVRRQFVHDTIVKTVSDALANAEKPKWLPEKSAAPPEERRPVPETPNVSESVSGFEPAGRETAETDAGTNRPPESEDDQTSRSGKGTLHSGPAREPYVPVRQGGSRDLPGEDSVRQGNFAPHVPDAAADIPSQVPENGTRPETPMPPVETKTRPVQDGLWETKPFGDLRVIGQFRGTYILCESGRGLILIDQHAAHERIVYEKLKKRSEDSEVAVQHLLIPETVDLSFSEANVIEEILPDLNAAGLGIEPFGGNTFVIKSVPAVLENRDMKPLVVEIAERIVKLGLNPGTKSAQAVENALDECLKLMACHGAIRANRKLSDEQIRELPAQLEQCENPSNCPHGRPTWIEWSNRFIEKAFSRIV